MILTSTTNSKKSLRLPTANLLPNQVKSPVERQIKIGHVVKNNYTSVSSHRGESNNKPELAALDLG